MVKHSMKVELQVNLYTGTVLTQNIVTPQLLTILVLKFETVHLTRLSGKFHPRYLPVAFTCPENTTKVANTGRLKFFALKYHRNIIKLTLK